MSTDKITPDELKKRLLALLESAGVHHAVVIVPVVVGNDCWHEAVTIGDIDRCRAAAVEFVEAAAAGRVERATREAVLALA